MNGGLRVFDARRCGLGEGALWHPLRRELFWFDITARRLFASFWVSGGGNRREWRFDEQCSAAGWIDESHLLIATETALVRFDIETGSRTRLVSLEPETPGNRSNDGRADPRGGFWIGTMGKNAEPGAGSIYRFCHGELRRLVAGLTIPNAICFAPGGRVGYFTDTPTRRIMRHELDDHGWPTGRPEVFADLTAETGLPDGAVVDRTGDLWVAMWGAGEVIRVTQGGAVAARIPLPVRQPTCPAFAGDGCATLVVTSAADGVDGRAGLDGSVLEIDARAPGRPEPAVAVGA